MSIFMLRRSVPQTDEGCVAAKLVMDIHGFLYISWINGHGYARFLPIQGLTVTCVEIRSLNHHHPLPTCLVNAPPHYIRTNGK